MKLTLISFFAALAVAQDPAEADVTVEVEGDVQAQAEEASQALSEALGSDQEAISNALDQNELGQLLNVFENFDTQSLEGAEEFTLFAPSDSAFETFLGENPDADAQAVSDVLAYHATTNYVDPTDWEDGESRWYESTLESEQLDTNLVFVVTKDGDSVTVSWGLGEASVTRSEVIDDGKSIVHYIDAVLEPPQSPSDTATAYSESAEDESQSLSSLVDALTQAELVQTVDDASNITIFAPTNAAFEEAGEVPEDQLESILTYHVVEGVAYSSDLEGTQDFTSLEGGNVQVEVSEEGEVSVNGARVIMADIPTNNGVVHIIEAVLNPEEQPEPQEPENASGKLTVGLAAVAVALMA